MTAKRRVVVTGIGCVTPLAQNCADSWDALLAGKNGIKPLENWDCSEYPVRIAGEIRDLDSSALLPPNKAAKLDRFVLLGMLAADEAVRDAGIEAQTPLAESCGVIAGSGIGGLLEIEAQHRKLLEKGPRRVSPFLIPKLMLNALSGNISMRFGMKGVNFATASACASAGHAIGMALRCIRYGDADIIVTGGAEAAITTLGMSGFANMKALSRRNDDPEHASRPFDKDRDGFVMGEGAGILVVEELEHARRRGAKIYCELAGVGMTGDGYHITQPAPEAEGAQRSMRRALEDGGIPLEEVDYVNAHGTSTPINDPNESLAIEKVFGDRASRLAVSSTKSMIGHLLGASAAVEAVVSCLSILHGVVHPTRNLVEPGEGCRLDYVPEGSRDLNVRAAISNSLGFGGHNVTLAFRKLES
ncbi:MAG TPA: beta-ketoacyl-[acyl-carrier-protein] synthase II [Planctomycetes bacterium]|nr:beta-ketoacyl-[acyl-carrier-protein] synthase II [Planctomycetota bacterium]